MAIGVAQSTFWEDEEGKGLRRGRLPSIWDLTMRSMPRGIRKTALVLVALVAWIVGWSLLLIPEWMTGSHDGIHIDLSGTYILNKKASQGGYITGLPYINYGMMDDGTEVDISQHRHGVVSLSYRWRNGYEKDVRLSSADNRGYERIGGTLCWKKEGVVWDNGKLEYFKKVVGLQGILPGLGTTTRRSTLGRSGNGDLQIDMVSTERGLTLFLIPLKERRTSTAVLSVATHQDKSDGPSIGGGRQPWPDAAQHEDQPIPIDL